MSASDKFFPTDIEKLVKLFLQGLNSQTILSLPKNLVFKPQKNDFFKTKYLTHSLDTPIGLAAGPHTQLAQNIVLGWLTGARFIELKTVQVLDDLKISKPCIDMQDEGYNCEWSQELSINQALYEYVKAWILIHILAHELGFDGPKTVFNFSIGYDFKGILSDKVQWFIDKITDASEIIEELKDRIESIYPKINSISIPSQISDSVTLSTMHGCPPDEIETITKYLIENKRLNTFIKLNPTLLGPHFVRDKLKKLGFPTQVPDLAFEHDLKFEQAIDIISKMIELSKRNNVVFGLKLTNTLESINNKNIFDKSNEMMYMSGRPLHVLAINLASKLQNHFEGNLNISFSAGVSSYNILETLKCGLNPITVCSDLLKPGGYGRFYQYFENLRQFNSKFSSIEHLILTTANETNLNKAICKNLSIYAQNVIEDSFYHRHFINYPSIKTSKTLDYFDCTFAPCEYKCPTNQKIPQYIEHIRSKNFEQAAYTILSDNPLIKITGYACDHTCQSKCTRINYDEPVKIRELKRFVADNFPKINFYNRNTSFDAKIAIIGGGPLGIAAAFFAYLNNFYVEIFEKNSYLGGTVYESLPDYRISQQTVLEETDFLRGFVHTIKLNTEIDNENFKKLTKEFDFVIVATGASLNIDLFADKANVKGLYRSLDFFRLAKQNKKLELGKKVAIIGGGNTAIDAARVALKCSKAEVFILYRRTIDLMPAHEHEILAAKAEGVQFIELVEPADIVVENDKIVALKLYKTKLTKKDNQRPIPERIPNTEFFFDVDTLIIAVGQQSQLFDKLEILKIPFTNYSNVYIGGDAARGGASIINAVADAKNIIFDICQRIGKKFVKIDTLTPIARNYFDLKLERVKVSFSKIKPNFSKDNIPEYNTLTIEEAVEEANRCLRCDLLCEACVSVCPNSANQAIKVFVKDFKVPFVKKNNSTFINEPYNFSLKEENQIVNIADWCNECGNCVTFCPTSGKPFEDKMKFHLNYESFQCSNKGFYFNSTEQILYYKNDKKHYSLKLQHGFCHCHVDNLWAIVDFHSGEILSSFIPDDYEKFDFQPFLQMAIILNSSIMEYL